MKLALYSYVDYLLLFLSYIFKLWLNQVREPRCLDTKLRGSQTKPVLRDLSFGIRLRAVRKKLKYFEAGTYTGTNHTPPTVAGMWFSETEGANTFNKKYCHSYQGFKVLKGQKWVMGKTCNFFLFFIFFPCNKLRPWPFICLAAAELKALLLCTLHSLLPWHLHTCLHILWSFWQILQIKEWNARPDGSTYRRARRLKGRDFMCNTCSFWDLCPLSWQILSWGMSDPQSREVSGKGGHVILTSLAPSGNSQALCSGPAQRRLLTIQRPRRSKRKTQRCARVGVIRTAQRPT